MTATELPVPVRARGDEHAPEFREALTEREIRALLGLRRDSLEPCGLRSRHFGVFAGDRPVAGYRILTGRRAPALLPSMRSLCPGTRMVLRRHLDAVLAAGGSPAECSRIALAAGAGPDAAVLATEGAIAASLLAMGASHLLLVCAAGSGRFYASMGFRPVPGTPPQFRSLAGERLACLQVTTESVPVRLRLRLRAIGRALLRSGPFPTRPQEVSHAEAA
jgi:hypothetical protein